MQVKYLFKIPPVSPIWVGGGGLGSGCISSTDNRSGLSSRRRQTAEDTRIDVPKPGVLTPSRFRYIDG